MYVLKGTDLMRTIGTNLVTCGAKGVQSSALEARYPQEMKHCSSGGCANRLGASYQACVSCDSTLCLMFATDISF